MATVVDICNLSLAHVGKKSRIQDINEASAEATACAQFYAHARDTLLADYDWHWARKTSSLAEVTNDKPGAWRYAYNRPVDCLKVLYVRPEYQDTESEIDLLAAIDPQRARIEFPYEAEGGLIYCNISPALLVFTRIATDPAEYPPLFVSDLSWQLSIHLAMPLTQDIRVRDNVARIARSVHDRATSADANEQINMMDQRSEFERARGGF